MNNFKKKLFNLEPLFYNSFYINIKNQNELIKKIKTALSNKYRNPYTVFYIYLGSIYYAATDNLYRQSLQNASFVYLDGFLVGTLRNINVEIVNLSYLHIILAWCAQKDKKVFLLGAKEDILSQAINNMNKSYTNLQIEGYSGYFKNNNKVIDAINKFEPELLIVSMGLSKQEKWIYKNQNKLKKIKVIIAGGTFADIMGGRRRFFPEVYKTLKIRWLYRLIKEPRRLYARYFISLSLLITGIFYFPRKPKQ